MEDQCRKPRPEPIVIAAAHFRDGMERIMRLRSARQLQRERDILHAHQPKKKKTMKTKKESPAQGPIRMSRQGNGPEQLAH